VIFVKLKNHVYFCRRHLLAAVFTVQLFTSCNKTRADTPESAYKNDAAYYLGLHAIDNQDETAAIQYFHQGITGSSPLAARRCAEALTLIGNVQDRITACKELVKKYNDADALLTAARELFRDGEYAQLINLTDRINFKEDQNELIRFRLESLAQKNDSRLEDELYQWLIARPCGSDQLEVYQLYETKKAEKRTRQLENEAKALAAAQAAAMEELRYAPPDVPFDPQKVTKSTGTRQPEQPTARQQIMEYRINVYRKDFASTYRQINQVLAICQNNPETPLFPQLISDMGKAALYGTENLDVAARRFDYLATQILSSKTDSEKTKAENAYYANFYSARLYDKDGSYPEQAQKHFIAAMNLTDDPHLYDNSLWYLLNTELRLSTEDIITSLRTYSGTWHDPAYFDDILESLEVTLLSNRQWQDICTVWQIIDKTATNETAGKFAYLSGRLLEENLADPGEGNSRKNEETIAFTRALSSGSDFYYKILAAARLNLGKEDLEKVLFYSGSPVNKDNNKNVEILLTGYAVFGFPQKIYPEWIFNRTAVSVPASVAAARFLQQCGITENQYLVQSLRMATRILSDAGSCNREILELNYPRSFSDEVTTSCGQTGLSEYALYALIRSESFFDQEIVSAAGATGLTQLMNTTASDVAKHLSVSEYDLQDPATNIQFGGYYLQELITRLDGSPLLAFFAYNAGISHVRGWMKTASDDYSKTGRPLRKGTGISIDLFLETLPFSETREYGRKVVSAAALYAWLYYGKSTNEVVREIMK
jgi:soluble lytic murein transglycosylase